MERIVRVAGLRKSFGRELVLDGISLEVGAGEAVGIVGPNGSGKTTLLRILAGLERADEGMVEVKCEVGYVYQENLLLPWKTIGENIALGLKYHRIKDAKDRIRAVVELFDLAHHMDKFPFQVSGGTARKASIARTLVLNPSLLLLDEPFTGLDMSSRDALKRSIKKIIDERRVSVIMVSHVLDDMVGLVDRVYVFTPRPARIAGLLDLKERLSYEELGRRLVELYLSAR